MRINLGGILSNSTIDYPGKVCAVVYLYGCNFRCPWCQNPELVEGDEFKKVGVSEIFKQLRNNFLIDAVCVTGGEPLLQEGIAELLKKIKRETKFLVKIDHNLSLPEQLKNTLKWIDMISVDIKASFEKYNKAAGGEIKIEAIKKSLSILKKWGKFKEARTTIVPWIEIKDIRKIAETVKENKFSLYTLQEFKSEKTLDESFEKKEVHYEKIREFGVEAKRILGDIKVQIVTKKNGFEEIIL